VTHHFMVDPLENSAGGQVVSVPLGFH